MVEGNRANVSFADPGNSADRETLRHPLAYIDRLGVRPHDRWLDVGAHHGGFALRAAALGADVRAYEPNEVCYEALLANAVRNGLRVDAKHAAVGAEHGRAVLSTGRAGCLSTIVKRVKGRRDVWVPLVAISTALGGRDSLKLDCEGGELEILRAADLSGVLRAFVEVHPRIVGEAGADECVEVLRARFSRVETKRHSAGWGVPLVECYCWS